MFLQLEYLLVCRSLYWPHTNTWKSSEYTTFDALAKLQALETKESLNSIAFRTLGDSDQFVSLIHDGVKKTLAQVATKQKKLDSLLTVADFNQSVFEEIRELGSISLRLNGETEVRKAIEFHFSHDDGIDYRVQLENINESLHRSN